MKIATTWIVLLEKMFGDKIMERIQGREKG